MNIIKKICKNWNERDGYKPEIIVIHISAGSLTSMTNWFSTPFSQASAHYGVGKDGSVIQYVEEDKKAWTQGRVNNPTAEIVKERVGVNPNNYCISIENEGMDLDNATVEQMRSLCELIKDIAKRNNIPLDRKHILGHFEIDSVNRPYCPSKNHEIINDIMTLLKVEDTVVVPRKLLVELSKFL